MNTARLIVGDCREVLRGLPAESVHCAVTSPPYWSLRDYGIPASIWGGDPACAHRWAKERVVTERGGNWQQGANGDGQGRFKGDFRAALGERKGSIVERGFCERRCGAWLGPIGLEPTPELWTEHIVEVFREVRRGLRADGTGWANFGDSFFGGKHPTLKEKDLVGQPWRAAFALQADGWYLRSDNIWAKPNPMPESVTDRPTRAHEYLFLLTKSARYFYDAEAIREPLTGPENENTPEDWARAFSRRRETTPEPRQEALIVGAALPDHAPAPKRSGNKARVYAVASDRVDDHHAASVPWVDDGRGKNKRTVWWIPPAPFTEAHFATFPPALVEPCVKAGTSDRGACARCGAPWVREVERSSTNESHAARAGTKIVGKGHPSSQVREDHDVRNGPTSIVRTVGWSPSCSCADAGDPVPCTVLDPFSGAGTTGLVALRLGRDYFGAELNPAYAEMSRRRIAGDRPMFNTVKIEVTPLVERATDPNTEASRGTAARNSSETSATGDL